jgi:peptidoglycan/LPS O-acetylase OafA/YrhL
MRAAASAASVPAWPPPTTITPKCSGYFISNQTYVSRETNARNLKNPPPVSRETLSLFPSLFVILHYNPFFVSARFPMIRSDPVRLPIIDVFKAVACMTIVLHHLAFYGPMSDVAYPLASDVFIGLSRYGRMAVQIFFVIAGFLAAKHFFISPADPFSFWKNLWKRYVRLIIPYSAALIVAMLAAMLARLFMVHESIPAAPSVLQFLLHLLLLQNILGFDSLSAGVWYVAIDFQLFLSSLLISYLCWRFIKKSYLNLLINHFLLIGLGLASLFYFNLDEQWDHYFLYFVAYYVIGITTYQIVSKIKTPLPTLAGVSGLILIIIIALSINFRERFIVALCTSLFFILFFHINTLNNFSFPYSLLYIGRISYSIFLIHFPICLVISALFSHFVPNDPWLNLLGIVFAFVRSLLGGALFFHYVEGRFPRRKPSSANAAR